MEYQFIIKTLNPFNEEVLLSESVWNEILIKHPEVNEYLHIIEMTVHSPDIIKSSIHDIRTKLYYTYYPEIYGGKYLCVVIKSVDKNYISTVYITNAITKGGKIIWKKQ
ncbi:MAG: hypothetical protein KJ607_13395 [Bacteroidetes bacterium]|nr:hypothetical protein [Bacteroidota bacterium]